MKRFSLFTYLAVISLLAASCYDEGGNNFDTVLPDVRIEIPESAYSGEMGQTIEIEPLIESEIADDDLSYSWEVLGELKNDAGQSYFSPLVEQQQRTLKFQCQLGDNITSLNKSYECRLRVRQKSTGRDFYSATHFTITITGVTGLMVLHGDDAKCDVGIVQAPEFMPSSSSIPTSFTAMPKFYSDNNGGNTLRGKGEAIVQNMYKYLSSEKLRQRARIYVKTSQEVAWLNKDDMSYYGDWDSMFYLTGADKINAGQPKGYVVMSSGAWMAFDGDELYYMSPSGAYPFLFPAVTPATRFGDRNAFTFQPNVITVDKRGIQCLMFTNTVNGSEQKGFVGISTAITADFPFFSALMDTKADSVAFNPGDMKADLMVMRSGGTGECMAVMRGDAAHPDYAGQFFMIDLMPNAAKKGGATPYSGTPQFIYGLDMQPDIDRAFAFEFGTTRNMCYYATPSGVYNYHVDAAQIYTAEPLGMTDGKAIQWDGEVTMMKMLDSPAIVTHNTDQILLVATYNGSQAALYALHLDTMTGRVVEVAKYDAGNVSGWNFGRIADVNIKGL